MPKGVKGFQKGVSGNPNGRPRKGETFAEALERESEELINNGTLSKRDALAKVLYQEASKGNLKAIEMIMDRIDGKPRQTVDQTNKNVSININQDDADAAL
jgi:hypothetical protein